VEKHLFCSEVHIVIELSKSLKFFKTQGPLKKHMVKILRVVDPFFKDMKTFFGVVVK